MSTTTTPTEAATTKANPTINKSVGAYNTLAAKTAVAFDTVRSTSKLETVKHGYTKQQLTTLLIDAGLDAPRTSEVCGFVFPAHANSRSQLDKAMEFNSKAKSEHDRIGKNVILALQRDKTGELTLEAAQAAHKAKNTGLKDSTTTRAPGGQTNQTATTPAPTKKKTAKEIEDERVTALIAIFKACAADEYSEEDIDSLCQRALEEGEVFPESEESEETEETSEK